MNDVGGPAKPEIVAIRDNKDYTRVLSYSYSLIIRQSQGGRSFL